VHANATGIISAVVAGALIAVWKLGALGLMLRALRPRGVWPAPCLAALLFGLMHLGALLVGGSPLPTLLVSLSYLFYGFAAAAVIVRTGLLWPLVLTYAVFLASAAATQDPHAPNLVASVEMILPALVVSAVLAIYGFLVRRRTPWTLEQFPRPVKRLLGQRSSRAPCTLLAPTTASPGGSLRRAGCD
jgi:hypothetical protein